MNVKITKLTDEKLLQKACEATMGGGSSKMTLGRIYKCKHSPIYTQMFWIELRDIPSFVSTHLVRHNVGVTHYVQSKRDDRGGTGKEGRYTPVNHSMLVNAMSLIQMSWKRLCFQSHEETVKVFNNIRKAMINVDVNLYAQLQPHCVYIGRCDEDRPCGKRQGGREK